MPECCWLATIHVSWRSAPDLIEASPHEAGAQPALLAPCALLGWLLVQQSGGGKSCEL